MEITKAEFWQLVCAMVEGMMANPAFAAEASSSYGRAQVIGQCVQDLHSGLECFGIQIVESES